LLWFVLAAFVASCSGESGGSSSAGGANGDGKPDVAPTACASAQRDSFVHFFDSEWNNPCVDPTGSGAFGEWIADADGRPCYDYRADPLSDEFPETFVTGGASRDHWHFIGNDAWGATAHLDGRIEIYDLSRGPKNLNRKDAATRNEAGGYKFLRVGDATFSTRRDGLPSGATRSMIFGMGYAEKTTEWSGLRVRERVTAPVGEDPVLLSTTEVTNDTAFWIEVEVVEYWDPNPTQLTFAPVMTYGLGEIFWEQRRRINERFSMTFVDDAANGIIGAGAITAHSNPPGADEPADIDHYPRTMFLAVLDDGKEPARRSLDRAAFSRWPDASAFATAPPEGQSLYGGDAV
ncbi:MAG: hypothetical protein KJ042_15355, partial [Deltaproteobacteria bacterium]|nr:hypothetical protein [Deltaproteobacteria bacterium]